MGPQGHAFEARVYAEDPDKVKTSLLFLSLSFCFFKSFSLLLPSLLSSLLSLYFSLLFLPFSSLLPARTLLVFLLFLLWTRSFSFVVTSLCAPRSSLT
jgi:hypothetical protein